MSLLLYMAVTFSGDVPRWSDIREGLTYANAGEDQITAWKTVTDAVHAKGSFIYLQLWGLGRVAVPEMIKAGGFDVRSASAIPFAEGKPVPRELTIEEIKSFVADYAQAARSAVEAGFDGVEIHDEYGGSIENRARFALEAPSAIVAIGAGKVEIRLSPYSDLHGMRMKDPVPQFTYVIKELRKLRLAYLHVAIAHVLMYVVGVESLDNPGAYPEMVGV
ncbi:hypothetical protein GGR53DRAFT_462029 [Hypoxylon sp. FL1150]|nr:hypothetical protein GGR53DRAFT_462029 [Hypoxylon sp. FL1150]